MTPAHRTIEHPDDHALARALASTTGRLLLAIRAGGLLRGARLGTTADRIAQDFIAEALGANRAGDAVLSEEAVDDRSRLHRPRVWIIDPLDGTREYSEGRDDWAVHVALVQNGVGTVAAIDLPAIGEAWSTQALATLRAAPQGPLRIVVSRSRPPSIAERVASRLGATLVPMGSAGAKFAALMRGDVHAYLHDGGMNEWDSCAPSTVAAAMGLHVTRLDGSALRYNRPDPRLPDFVACRPELTERLMQAIREG